MLKYLSTVVYYTISRLRRFIALGSLHAQEYLVAVEEEENQPPEKHEAHLQQQESPHLRQKPRQPSEDLAAERREAPRPLQKVDRYGVHPDHLEEEAPFRPSAHVNDPVQRAEERERDAAREKHVRRRPEWLDAPAPSQVRDAGTGQRHGRADEQVDRLAVPGIPVPRKYLPGEDAQVGRRYAAERVEEALRTVLVRNSVAEPVVEHGHEVAVSPRIAPWREHERQELRRSPVAEEAERRERPVALLAEVQGAERGDRPAEPDAPEYRVEPHVREVEVQQPEQHRAQHEQDGEPPQYAKRDPRLRETARQATRERKRPRGAGEEDEEGEDQVVVVKAAPVCVRDLHGQELRHRRRQGLRKRRDHARTAGDPEHVIAAEDVDGQNALLHKVIRYHSATEPSAWRQTGFFQLCGVLFSSTTSSLLTSTPRPGRRGSWTRPSTNAKSSLLFT